VKKVLVVGDAIADVYCDCSFKKMCPDAPETRAVVVQSRDLRPGGAANVALNMVALAPDVRVSLIAEIDVEMGFLLKRRSWNKLDLEYIVRNDGMLTKERILIDGQLVLRKDNRSDVGPYIRELIEHKIRDYLSENDPDLIIVSDYAHGSLSEASWDMLLACRDRLLVDTKKVDLSMFRDGDRRTKLIKLNRSEWSDVVARDAIPERYFEAFIVTLGADGAELMMHKEMNDKVSVTNNLKDEAHGVSVVDVCGCGDTFMAGLAASLLKNDDYFTAMQFANAAAATVVSQPRTAVADLSETLRLLDREE
jgi:D-beta-D-heptose 7-phosphate kinase/D-beta-D-heptose 1-phosphate adenosyltransferase